MNGIDAEMFTPAPNKTKNARLTLLFTGVMNFGPNVAASMFLIKNVLQEVSTPLHLRIVGRNPAPELVALAQSSRVHDIEVTGMIPNIVEEYQRADLFVAPIWGSTGTKNKVLEALACGLPVLTTTDVTSGFTDPFPPVLACTDSHTFIARLRDIAKCPDVLGELGRAGREYACNLGWEARTARLISAMQPPSRS
jgi:glycosyltransferase involved in cell wall biosynthesis